MSKIVKNLDSIARTFGGQLINSEESYNCTDSVDLVRMQLDSKLMNALTEDTPKAAMVDSNNLLVEITGEAGVRFLLDKSASDTDGKCIIHQTSRPLGTYTYFTGAGDDQTDPHAIGGDENVTYIALTTGSASKYIDLNMIVNRTHIHEGYLQWVDAKGDIIKMEMVPQTTAYTASTNKNYNLYGGYLIIPAAGDGLVDVQSQDIKLVECVPNEFGVKPAGFWNATWNTTTKQFDNITAASLGDGEYNMFGVEVILARFCNWIPALGSGFIMLQSSDQSQVGHGIRFKITAKTKGDDHAWECAAFLTFHRKLTC